MLLIAVIGALIIMPFYKMRVRWAVDLWRRIRLIVILYCVVIFVAAIARLVFNFDAIYG